MVAGEGGVWIRGEDDEVEGLCGGLVMSKERKMVECGLVE